MKKSPLFLSLLVVATGVAVGGWWTLRDAPRDTSTAPSTPLVFYPDPGVRMEDASNPGVRLNEDGSLDVLFASEEKRSSLIANALEDSDWLDFTVTEEDADIGVFRAHVLPDGTCRTYGYDSTKGVSSGGFTSRSAEDCLHFTSDQGVRYTLQDADEGRAGVYEFFNDSVGGVVMLYLGDLMGANNVRRAYSSDNGETFTFTNDNVFGDEDAGGGAKSYVDEKVIALPNGDFRAITMKQGSLYSFLSTDDGKTFQLEDGTLLSPDVFTEFTVRAFYDPQMIQLPDGRYRIYVTAGIPTGETLSDGRAALRQVIVSATTRL